jgi:lipopolysaccharide biosynthesis glycosyltransferase
VIKKNVIISLADSNYFELLNELVDSIKRFKQSETTAICILDGGLTDEQKKILASKVDEIKSSEWDIKISQFKTMGKKWLKSLITRAFLTEYFPNYEKYLWIDADAWVNSWEAIELYFRGCENNKLCISTNADRAYGGTRVNWVLGSFARIKSQNYKHAKASGFSEKIAREVAFKPHLNAGVFSLAANAPHWKMWRKNLEFSLKSGKVWGSDQIALNITIYHDNLPVEILPAYCNWTHVGGMKYDEKKKNICLTLFTQS